MTTPSANYSLPGVTVSIGDFGLRISAPLPGPKLTLIGATTSTLGGSVDLNEPYLIQSFPTAIVALKNADGTDSELSLAVEKAVEAGADHVEIVICSDSSSYTNENARWDSLKASLTSLKHHPLDWVISDNAWFDATGLTGTGPDGEARTDYRRMFGDFCHRATAIGNTVRAVVGMKPLLKVALDETWSVAPTSQNQVDFDYPTLSQVNEYEYHVRGENGVLENHSAETTLTGHVQGSVEASPGVIHPAYDGWAKDDDGSQAYDHLGNKVDGGRAITIFGGICRQALSSTRTRAAQQGYGGETSQNTNGAVAFAAALTKLQPGESITNKTIPSILPARSIPASLATALLNARICTMVNRTNGFVVSKGITAAHNAGPYTKSDFTNISTYDVVILAVDISKARVEKYIGKQSAPEIINAMQNELDQGLHTLIQAGLASRVTASIIQTRDQQILGDLDIELDIVPYGEISTINFRALLHRE
jgi:hypothetical protein